VTLSNAAESAEQRNLGCKSWMLLGSAPQEMVGLG